MTLKFTVYADTQAALQSKAEAFAERLFDETPYRLTIEVTDAPNSSRDWKGSCVAVDDPGWKEREAAKARADELWAGVLTEPAVHGRPGGDLDIGPLGLLESLRKKLGMKP